MNLKKMRKKEKMSQIDVSKAVGVHLNTYALWEKGGGNPSEENMIKLKNLFHKHIQGGDL